METLIYRLIPGGAFHLGAQGLAREGSEITVPSDTLFGAVVSAWAVLGYDTAQLLASFQESISPLLLSSTYPYIGQIRLYPRPLLRTHISAEKLIQARHKARWVTEALWGQLVNYHPLEAEDLVLEQHDQIWATRQDSKVFQKVTHGDQFGNPYWQFSTVPRVSLDRVTNASQVYQVGRVMYHCGCGLWFAARTADDDWRRKLEHALDLLADHGLGGLRSVGYGAFRWERWQDAELVEAERDGDYTLNLARYAPPASEILALLDPRALYRLELVPGWFRGDGRNWRRRSVRLVGEGSLLRKPVSGMLVDVTPSAIPLTHPVYRYGYAFPIRLAPEAVPTAQEVVYG